MPAKKRGSGYHAIYKTMANSKNPSDDIQDFAVLSLVGHFTGQVHATQPDYLIGPSRGSRHLSRARQKMQYLAHVGFGLSFTQIGVGMQRDRTSVAHACRQIEDSRDCPSMDKALFFSEIALQMMIASLCHAPEDLDTSDKQERKNNDDPC